jgi:hypothetical protein
MDCVPHRGNGSVLVTSRDPYAKEHFFSHGSGVDLEPLSTADSAALLHNLVTRANQAKTADENAAFLELASHLDGLPLAMTQMAAFIRRRHLSIREFLTLYSNDAQYAEIHRISNPVQDHRYGYTLAKAYSFHGLGDNATRLLRLLSFLSPDRIQEYSFVNPAKAATQKEQTRLWTTSMFESARCELLSCSIIKRNIQRGELWIHRLIQAEVRTRIKREDRYQVFKDTVALMAELWPPGNHSSQRIRRWAVCEELLPHWSASTSCMSSTQSPGIEKTWTLRSPRS